MEKRICPKCSTSWYSSNETEEFWICQNCNTKIFKPKKRLALSK